jgi:toxin YhaV
MSAPLVRHGWTIAFQPQLFARQVVERKAEVKRLKQELDPQSFVQHPQVNLLLAAVMEGIKERIAADRYASRFALRGPLRRYGRLKGLGLPDRYRLFLRPFEAEDRRLLLSLWLGLPAGTATATTATPCSRAWCSAASCRRTGRACGASSTPAEGTTSGKGRQDPEGLPLAGSTPHLHHWCLPGRAARRCPLVCRPRNSQT